MIGSLLLLRQAGFCGGRRSSGPLPAAHPSVACISNLTADEIRAAVARAHGIMLVAVEAMEELVPTKWACGGLEALGPGRRGVQGFKILHCLRCSMRHRMCACLAMQLVMRDEGLKGTLPVGDNSTARTGDWVGVARLQRRLQALTAC